MEEANKITNRHIAKLLGRLEPLHIPEIAEAEIKRQMHFLKEDLISEKIGASENGKEIRNY